MAAPKLDTLATKVSTKNNITIFGCGGCGLNIVNEVIKGNKGLGSFIKGIDTSKANIVDMDEALVESFELIDDLEGSGKLRSENVDQVVNFMDRITISDFNIVVFSLSGGSGSVIGPLLINEILRNKKIAIGIVVADTASNIDARNTIGTIKSLENMADQNKAYLPIVLLDNTKGRTNVDQAAVEVIKIISTILIRNAKEMDKQDKLNFFRPNKLINLVKPGLSLLNASYGDGNWISDAIVQGEQTGVLDSVLLISPTMDYPELTIKTHVIYVGFDSSIESMMVMSLGYQIPEEFIDRLNGCIRNFKSIAPAKKDSIETEMDDDLVETSAGLIL